MNVQCDGCGLVGSEEDIHVTWPNIPGLAERLEPGGIIPVGECPECGALVYEESNDPSSVEMLLAPGLADPICAKEANEALDKRGHADYQCFMLLKHSLIPLLDCISEGDIMASPETLQDIEIVCEEAQDIIQDREIANDKFLKAMAGRRQDGSEAD